MKFTLSGQLLPGENFNTEFYNRFQSGLGFGSSTFLKKIVRLTDGKVLIGGKFDAYNGNPANGIIRLNPDGSVDQTFSSHSTQYLNIEAIVAMPDGKILIAGEFSSYGGINSKNIMRLNSDGSPDLSFQCLGTSSDEDDIKGMVVTQSGKIIVCGDFNAINGVERHGVARLNVNGTTDLSYGSTEGFNSLDGQGFDCIALLADGSVLIGGYFTNYAGDYSAKKFAKINPSGQLVSGFAASIGGWQSKVFAIDVAPDGKIFVCGNFDSYGGVVRKKIACLNPDGTLYQAFNGQFEGTWDSGSTNGVAFSSNGDVYVIGGWMNVNQTECRGVVKLSQNGSLDLSFANVIDGGAVNSCQVANDGKIYCVGSFESSDSLVHNGIVCLNIDGTLNNEYAPGTAVLNSYHYSDMARLVEIVGLPDGKLIIGGVFGEYNGQHVATIARLNPDGTLDTSFETDFHRKDFVNVILLQPDGKMLVGGAFKNYNGSLLNNLVRLNPNGSRDMTFNPGTGPNGNVSTMVIQPDGKILIGGSFDSFDGNSCKSLIRLLPDGTIDPDFNLSLSNSNVYKVILLQSGKIYVAFNYGQISRLLSNGTEDYTFYAPAISTYEFKGFEIQPDGRLLVAGPFSSSAFYPDNRQIIRLNTNGNRDMTFVTPLNGQFGYIDAICLQDDGRLLVATDTVRLLNSDGSINNFLTHNLNTIGKIEKFYITDDQLIGVGMFSEISGFSRNCIFGTTYQQSLNLNEVQSVNNRLVVYPNPAINTVEVSGKNFSGHTLILADLTGKIITSQMMTSDLCLLDISNLERGIYVIKVDNGVEQFTGRFIRQ